MSVNSGELKLLFGDCLDAMSTLSDNSIAMVLCDLPYGTTQNKWDSVIPFPALWTAYRRLCRGAVVLTAQAPFDKALGASNIGELKYEWIWEKPKATGHLNCSKQPMKAHENVLVFYARQPTYNPQMRPGLQYKPSGGGSKLDNYGAFGNSRKNDGSSRYPRTVLEFMHETNPVHPTQKPVALMEYLIRTYTNPGDTVLDNCMGSGTTGVACLNTGRNFVGIERDETYFWLAHDRITDAR